ncbi:ABC transporter ATP-binding protein, partial [bacterium]|nr:ABC transporter ATP-binding protein [bacterium]
MITAEVEPLGGFIGDAMAVPAFQGGSLLVYLVFIFAQDPVLGLAAVTLYPFQGWLIPRLQRRVNLLGKQRVRAMRGIADRIGDTVAGIREIHAHDATAWHRADIADRLGDVYDIRMEIYQRKFFIKFLNNFINQLTPFFFYAIGG